MLHTDLPSSCQRAISKNEIGHRHLGDRILLNGFRDTDVHAVINLGSDLDNDHVTQNYVSGRVCCLYHARFGAPLPGFHRLLLHSPSSCTIAQKTRRETATERDNITIPCTYLETSSTVRFEDS